MVKIDLIDRVMVMKKGKHGDKHKGEYEYLIAFSNVYGCSPKHMLFECEKEDIKQLVYALNSMFIEESDSTTTSEIRLKYTDNKLEYFQ